jgi:2-polyprenyl-3-methyl-5-hydroxy-6-metoxy-1,4-benzoquinol methylase
LKYSEKFFESRCPVCGSKKLTLFFQLSNVPLFANVFRRNKKEAIDCPKGDIELVFCPICGHIMNRKYDPNKLEYTKNYENPLDFSPTFQSYAKSLAEKLIKEYNLHKKNLISIGLGKSKFLSLLCDLGNNVGVGFDPAFSNRKETENLNNRIKLIGDSYSQKYAHIPSDFIFCRHVLEHIYDPKEFLKIIRATIAKKETKVFFEVPNGKYEFCKTSFWDIIYEHYSYFTPSSLSYLFSSSGFHVEEIKGVYSKQFLTLVASPSDSANSYPESNQKLKINKISKCITTFAPQYKKKIKTLNRQLNRFRSKKERVVAWGAGSKGVMFLNSFKDDLINYVVDINPNKQGMYIPGTGHLIMEPNFLLDYNPNIIIVMNPIYIHEIQQLIDKYKLDAKVLSP